MTALIIIGCVLGWLALGYFTAYLDFKYDVICRKEVNDNIVILTLFGGITLLALILVIVVCVSLDLVEKLKFKED